MASTIDTVLKQITLYGSERLSKLSVSQRRDVTGGLEELEKSTAKNLRTHTIQALNPRANPRDTITALLDEMKTFLAAVNAHITEVCLDGWDKGIAAYNKDLPLKGKGIMTEWADGQAAELAKRKERSDKDVEKKMERVRAAGQTELDSRTNQIRVVVQKEQEEIVSWLEAEVAERDAKIAEALGRAESAEELVESLRENLVDRTRILETANEQLKQEERIKERNFDMHMKRKDGEVADVKAELDRVMNRKKGIASPDGSPPKRVSPLKSPLTEPEPEPELCPEPGPEREPEPRPESPATSQSLETARELAAMTWKLQATVDSVARVAKERDMLLSMVKDRNDQNSGVGTMMEELAAVKAERDLLLDLLNQEKGNRQESAVAALAAAGETAPVVQPVAAVAGAATGGGEQSEAAMLDMAVAASVESMVVDEATASRGVEGEELVRNIEELVTKDRVRRVEIQALRAEAGQPPPPAAAPESPKKPEPDHGDYPPVVRRPGSAGPRLGAGGSSAAQQLRERRENAMAAKGGIALPFGERIVGPLDSDERAWAASMQRKGGRPGNTAGNTGVPAGILRQRPMSAPAARGEANLTSASVSSVRSGYGKKDVAGVSVINLNEEMAMEQAARGGVFGAKHPNGRGFPQRPGSPENPIRDDVQSFLEASQASIGSLLGGVGSEREHRLGNAPARPSSAGPPRRRSLERHMEGRRRPPVRNGGPPFGAEPGRRQRAGSWREKDILQTGTTGLSGLESRLSRG